MFCFYYFIFVNTVKAITHRLLFFVCFYSSRSTTPIIIMNHSTYLINSLNRPRARCRYVRLLCHQRRTTVAIQEPYLTIITIFLAYRSLSTRESSNITLPMKCQKMLRSPRMHWSTILILSGKFCAALATIKGNRPPWTPSSKKIEAQSEKEENSVTFVTAKASGN